MSQFVKQNFHANFYTAYNIFVDYTITVKNLLLISAVWELG